jgi:serine/threonine-protein kinase
MGMLRPDSTAIDIWVYDLTRETLGRLTFSDADDGRPVWSPDGKRIAFYSLRDGVIPNMYLRRADGSGEVERLQVSNLPQIPCGFTPDGNTVIYSEVGDTKGDLWSLSLEEGATPEPFLVTPFNEKHPALSPDGKWLAYTSNESGREEIYLRPFPKAAGKWQVSTSGGQHAMWSPDGTELFYEEDNDLMDVVIDLSAGAPMIGRPSTLFELPMGVREFGRGYDISPDGQRFVAVKAELRGGDFGESHLRFVFHWFSELETKIPKSKK